MVLFALKFSLQGMDVGMLSEAAKNIILHGGRGNILVLPYFYGELKMLKWCGIHCPGNCSQASNDLDGFRMRTVRFMVMTAV